MRALRWWMAGYVVMFVAVLMAMYATRDQVLAAAADKSVAAWQAWREDVARQQTAPGPVERRVPKSSDPPALVLMRDYFAVSLLGAIVFSTALYWTLAWFISGMVQ